MSRGSLFAIAVLLGVTSGPLRADGLLYQLASDGAWVKFQGELTDRSGAVRPIEVVLKSVGRMDDVDNPQRWIELKAPAEDQTQIIKLLIPEKELKEGADPIANVVRGWRRVAGESAKGLSHGRGFWQQVLLAGALHNVQPLEKALVESKLGRLECAGLTGQATVREDDGYELALSYEVRRHPKAPFGVVACRIQCDVSKNGKPTGTTTIDLYLSDFGTDAESELPGYL
jgi:hypothetical protein